MKWKKTLQNHAIQNCWTSFTGLTMKQSYILRYKPHKIPKPIFLFGGMLHMLFPITNKKMEKYIIEQRQLQYMNDKGMDKIMLHDDYYSKCLDWKNIN